MFDADAIRLSDLDGFGLLGVGLSVFGLGWLVIGTLTELVRYGGEPLTPILGGTMLVVFGGFMAYENGSAELEGTCEHCGDYFRVHSGRDTVSEVIRVEKSGSPRRLDIGPFSMILQRQDGEHHYCSAECAGEDTRTAFGPRKRSHTTAREGSEIAN